MEWCTAKTTFTEGWLAGPLGWMSRYAGNGDFADELEALVAEEAQGFTCLVVMLVQCLVPVVWDTRVQAGLIFHCKVDKVPLALTPNTSWHLTPDG